MPERKLLVLLKERVLLENSQIFNEISGEYPWLVNFLERNPNAKTTDLDNFEDEVQNFFKHRYNQIVTQAASEWASHKGRPVDIKDTDEMFECEFCHHKPIRFVFCIVNKLNGKELNVGGECVKHFGMNLGKDVRQLMKEMKEVRRLNSLEKAIPGIKKTISGWEGEMEILPVLIPLSLEEPYLQLGAKAKKIYTEYLQEDIFSEKDPDYFNKLQKILEQKQRMLKTIQEYVETNKNAKYVPGKEIISWIKRTGKNDDTQLLRWLKEDGKITWRTAFRIGEPSYLKSLILDFNEHLRNTRCSIEKLDHHKGSDGYIINVNSGEIRIFTKCRGFITDFGGLLFGETVDKPLDFINLMQNGTAYGENSANKIVSNLENRVNELGYGIYRQEYEYNELIFQQKGADLYVIEKLEQFVEKFKLLAFGLDDDGTAELQAYFKTLDGKKKISKEDLNYLLGQR